LLFFFPLLSCRNLLLPWSPTAGLSQAARAGLRDLRFKLVPRLMVGTDGALRVQARMHFGKDARSSKRSKRRRGDVDAGRPELKQRLEFLREGDTLLVTKIDRLARSTSDLYRILSSLAEKGVQFKVIDDPSIDTTSRTGKLVMGILALIAEFENDIRRERQMDGIKKAKERGVRFGRKLRLVPEKVKQIRQLRAAGSTVPDIIRQMGLSKASVYRALGH